MESPKLENNVSCFEEQSQCHIHQRTNTKHQHKSQGRSNTHAMYKEAEKHTNVFVNIERVENFFHIITNSVLVRIH